MKRSIFRFEAQLVLLATLCLGLVWGTVSYEIYRSYHDHIRAAQVRTSVQAHVFAEYSRSTIKRINEFILDIRSRWTGDWEAFSELVVRTQENIDDLTFQVAVIDKDGILAFSNLAKPTDRTDLSEREHFRVHKQANNADHLFVSKPIMGKVSGKWSIQLTRPIFKNGQFNGVVVVSVSPDQFAAFAKKMLVSKDSAATVVRNTGEIMARYPAIDAGFGLILRDRPFLNANAPISGSYRQVSATDGQERIFGFYTLPEYGMHFLLGESINDILAPHHAHRNAVLLVAVIASLLISALFFMLFHSLTARETIRQQLMTIFELSPDGFVSFDTSHRVMYASPAFLSLTGLRRDDIIGVGEQAFSEQLARICIEKNRFPDITSIRESLSNEEGNKDRRRPLIELAGASKRVLEYDIRISNAVSVSQILYFRDVTHESEVDRLKSEFLSTAAHELRTPMTTIYGFAELLLERDFDEASRRDFLDTIVRQSRLTVSILNELLDLVRIEERRGKDFNIEQLDLCELLHEIVAGFGIPEGRTPPSLPIAATPFWVRIDRKKLTQAISNVLSNAYKYSSTDSAVEINLSQTPSNGNTPSQTSIRITDHGIGMTPQQLARVGERFYRADTSGKIPGTGLGISIVREIVNLHGGNIEVESTFGAGTTVTLQVPTANDGTKVNSVKIND